MKKSAGYLVIIFIFILINSGFSQTPFRASLSVGVNSALSDFANQYKGGFSAEGGAFYSLPKSDIDLTLLVGYNNFTYNNAYVNDLVLKNLGMTIDYFTYKWSASDIPVMAGARFKFPSGTLKPYLAGEIGFHYVQFNERFNGDTITASTGNPPIIYFSKTEKSSEIGLGFGLSFGFEFNIYPKVNIDLNAKYNYGKINCTKAYTVFLNQNKQFTATPLEKMSFFTLKAGLVVDL